MSSTHLCFQTPNMDKVHNVLRNPSKMSQLVTNDNLPSFVQDKMARTYASWLQWWKSTITSDDYMKYLSTQVSLNSVHYGNFVHAKYRHFLQV